MSFSLVFSVRSVADVLSAESELRGKKGTSHGLAGGDEESKLDMSKRWIIESDTMTSHGVDILMRWVKSGNPVTQTPYHKAFQ